MPATVIPLRGGYFRATGDVSDRHFTMKYRPSKTAKRKCTMCGRLVRRSWRTHILHAKCRVCRYLIMMYGPNITVKLVE